MATQPRIVADFEAQLATAISIGSTSFSLSSALDDDGNTIQSGLYYFTIDNGSTNKEYLAGTVSGTSVTAVVSVSRQGVETSGAVRAHRIGASVILTDFNTFQKYMDNAAVSGAVDASTSAKGITKISVAPVSDPIAVGDNDPRVPTQGENDGLAATTTPATTNLFVTQKDLQKGAVLYAADAGATDSYAITLSPAPAAYVAGMVCRFKANTINTGGATLNVNSLGAIAIVKKQNVALSTGDIKANQIVEVIYDGTNFQLLSPISSVALSSGVGSHDLSVNGADTIAHGLGSIPSLIRITGYHASSSCISQAFATYVASTQVSISLAGDVGSTTGNYESNAAFNIFATIATVYVSMVITADATNITLTFTKQGSPTGQVNYVWEAIA